MSIDKNILEQIALTETNLKVEIDSKQQNDVLTIQFVIAPEQNKDEDSKKDSKKETKKADVIVPLAEYPMFEAKAKEILQTPTIWFVGVGTLKSLESDIFAELVRELAGRLANKVEKVQIEISDVLITKISSLALANIFAVSFFNATYPIDLLKTGDGKTKPKLTNLYLLIEAKNKTTFEKDFSKYEILAHQMNMMRHIQALPGNYLFPESMAERAKLIGKKYNLDVKIFDKKQLTEMGAGGILAVAEGSAKEPRMIVLEYNQGKASKEVPTLVLVGKGVTFDTGGISLKPGSDMHEMKYDMSGSAAVFSAITAIAQLKLPIHVVGVVGMVENMPGSKAFKPGDVYTSLKGTTIEVQNTDAEGRLILGDLLYYAEKHYKPTLMINLATLTGAVVVALGQFYAGLFSRHKEVVNYIQKASDTSMEPVWHLPMTKQYLALLKSDIADYNNIGGRYGGSSSAASFLSIFVEETTKWAHLDIAGVAYLKSPFHLYSTVPTGYGVRLLVEIAENMIADISSLEASNG